MGRGENIRVVPFGIRYPLITMSFSVILQHMKMLTWLVDCQSDHPAGLDIGSYHHWYMDQAKVLFTISAVIALCSGL